MTWQHWNLGCYLQLFERKAAHSQGLRINVIVNRLQITGEFTVRLKHVPSSDLKHAGRWWIWARCLNIDRDVDRVKRQLSLRNKVTVRHIRMHSANPFSELVGVWCLSKGKHWVWNFSLGLGPNRHFYSRRGGYGPLDMALLIGVKL